MERINRYRQVVFVTLTCDFQNV